MDLYTLYYLCLLESSFLWLFHIGHQMHLCLNQAWTMVHAWFRLETQSTNTVCVCVFVFPYITLLCVRACSVGVQMKWQKCDKMKPFGLLTPSHIVRYASLEINYVNMELCKLCIWINLWVWGEKHFGVVLYFEWGWRGGRNREQARERTREDKDRQKQRVSKWGLGWRRSLADSLRSYTPDLAF